MTERLFYIFGYALIVISLIPLIRNDNWIFRIFEYPRVQKLVLTIAMLGAFLILADGIDETDEIVFVAAMSLNIGYLCYQIWPYTIFSKKQMLHVKDSGDGDVRLLISNVLQDNRNTASLLKLIQEKKPDIVLLVETDKWWADNLTLLNRDYQYRVHQPMENTYGMLLYSRLELIDPQVRFLIEDDIPSISTDVRLASGKHFRLFCLHPEPPVPNENPRSTERDAEILLVAKEAKALKCPVIVAGDLNDVAWSYTTELFLKVSGLLDPRRGRGFFNTFHVNHPLWRWPLDHVFCSEHFSLSSLERMRDMGSDHFPMFISLTLAKKAAEKNADKKMHASQEEYSMAERKIQKEKDPV